MELALEAREVKYTYHSERSDADRIEKEKDMEKICAEHRKENITVLMTTHDVGLMGAGKF